MEVGAEEGYSQATIELLVERAGVDRAEFDLHFLGKYDCFLSAWHELNNDCVDGLLTAYNQGDDWIGGLYSAVEWAVAALTENPSLGAFAIDVLSAGRAARARRDMTLKVIAGLIDSGREEAGDPDISHMVAEALAGSIASHVCAKAATGRLAETATLVPDLVSTIVIAYRGSDQALQELAGRSPGEVAGAVGGNRAGIASMDAGRSRLPSVGPRERLIAGFATAVFEVGYERATVPRVARAASLSPEDFHRHFTSKEACLVAAFDAVVLELHSRFAGAYDEAGGWPSGVRPGLASMLEFLIAEPALAHLSMVETLGSGRVTSRGYDTVVERFVPYLDPDHGQQWTDVRDGRRPRPSTGEVLVRGILSVVSSRIMTEGTEDLEALLPDLTAYALAPFLGPIEAGWLALG